MSILRDLANYYLVKKELIKKEGNPYHAEDGKFASKDNYKTVRMDVASNVKNKKMTDKDWDKVKSIDLDLTDSDIVDLETHGTTKLKDIINNNIKSIDNDMKNAKNPIAIDFLRKQREKLQSSLKE